MSEKLQKTQLLGINITIGDKSRIIEEVFKKLEKKESVFYIVTPNPEIIVFASGRPQFASILNQAEYCLPDGIGVVWAAQILRLPTTHRITGIDFLEEFCKKSVNRHITIGFLGSLDGIAKKAAECLQEKYPGLKIVYTASEWNQDDFMSQISAYQLKKIDILFVAFGFPKQEEWISVHIGKIPVTAMMTVGGSFDILSGKLPRAPRILQSLGLEWLFRLIIQPWRIKRQLALTYFILLVLRKRLSSL